jgi:hypothetical protein
MPSYILVHAPLSHPRRPRFLEPLAEHHRVIRSQRGLTTGHNDSLHTSRLQSPRQVPSRRDDHEQVPQAPSAELDGRSFQLPRCRLQKPSLNNLSESLLATVLSHALPERRPGLTSSIMNTARMFKRTTTARPISNFLLVNKKFNRVGQQVWAQTDFCHVYMNSWTPLPRGLVSSISSFPLVVMALDIRRGDRSLSENLVSSALVNLSRR